MHKRIELIYFQDSFMIRFLQAKHKILKFFAHIRMSHFSLGCPSMNYMNYNVFTKHRLRNLQ